MIMKNKSKAILVSALLLTVLSCSACGQDNENSAAQSVASTKATEVVTEKITEPTTEKSTESATEKVTESSTEKTTEEITEAVVEQETETVTEGISDSRYENNYFSVDVPESWGDNWSVSEKDNSLNGIESTLYSFSHKEENQYGGGATVYILDMSDTSRPLGHYNRMIPSGCEHVGKTTNGYDVFMIEAGAGFFSAEATITLK